MKTQRWSRGMAPLILSLNGDEWSTSRPDYFIPEKNPVHIEEEVEWTPQSVGTFSKTEKPFTPAGILIPDI
jgi:hypothetical protein